MSHSNEHFASITKGICLLSGLPRAILPCQCRILVSPLSEDGIVGVSGIDAGDECVKAFSSFAV